jgi:hypothetical protein
MMGESFGGLASFSLMEGPRAVSKAGVAKMLRRERAIMPRNPSAYL